MRLGVICEWKRSEGMSEDRFDKADQGGDWSRTKCSKIHETAGKQSDLKDLIEVERKR